MAVEIKNRMDGVVTGTSLDPLANVMFQNPERFNTVSVTAPVESVTVGETYNLKVKIAADATSSLEVPAWLVPTGCKARIINFLGLPSTSVTGAVFSVGQYDPATTTYTAIGETTSIPTAGIIRQGGPNPSYTDAYREVAAGDYIAVRVSGNSVPACVIDVWFTLIPA